MMDIKGLAWIGNIYDKFETMCLEMEEVMYEDTIKYVENQVQTVGASVKRFYSEVMQDLHQDSCVDPVKVAAADLSLKPCAHPEMKLKASAKKDARETNSKSIDDCVISGKIKTGAYRRPIASRKGNSEENFRPPLSGPVSPFSENLRNLSSLPQMKRSREMGYSHVGVILPSAGIEEGSRNANEKTCKPLVDAGLPMYDASVNSPAAATEKIVSVVSSDQKPADSASTSSFRILPSGTSAVGICTNSGVISQTEKTIATGTDSRKSVEEELTMAHKERLDDCGMDAAKNDDTIDPEVEIIEPFNESILEETCVLVEGDELQFIRQGKGTHKSFKKILREAFSSKMRLKRKEYEQLVARYTEQSSNEDGAERAKPDCPAESNAETLPAHSSETGWELL